MKSTIMYCREGISYSPPGVIFDHFAPHPEVSRLYDKDLPVFKVQVREMREGERSNYWAMWDPKTDKFEFCYHDRRVLDMCFPYGIKGEEEYGRGKAYNVVIEVLERDVIPK